MRVDPKSSPESRMRNEEVQKSLKIDFRWYETEADEMQEKVGARRERGESMSRFNSI